MKKTISIFCFVTAISCGQDTKKDKVIEPTAEEVTVAEVPYHQFVDLMLAQVDSTEASTHKIFISASTIDLASDKEDFLKLKRTIDGGKGNIDTGDTKSRAVSLARR